MIFRSVPYESFRIDSAAKVVVKLCALRHVHQKRSQRERIPASDIKRLLNPSFGALCGRSAAAQQQSMARAHRIQEPEQRMDIGIQADAPAIDLTLDVGNAPKISQITGQ